MSQSHLLPSDESDCGSPASFSDAVGSVSPWEISQDASQSSQDGSGSDIQITTTVGSGLKKRKEVITLPLAPGTLPPRKRAKTKDEKEQRRIERIMRNRQAAHASREKKRKHVEELEKKCVSLTSENEKLQSQVQEARESEARTLEQQYLLMGKLQQVQNALAVAKRTGDLSGLDIDQLTAPVPVVAIKEGELNTRTLIATSPASSINMKPALLGSPAIKEESCASPDSLILSTFTAPSLSSSVTSSPLNSGEELDLKSADEFYSFFDTSLDNKAHHPAVMMPSGPQRRSTRCSRSLSIPILLAVTV